MDTIPVSELEKNTSKSLKENPTKFFFDTDVFSSDGRLTAKVQGIKFDSKKINSKTSTIDHDVIQQYIQYIIRFVNGAIYPALQIIRCEHNIQINDIMTIVQKSNLIPQDRVEVFAKGLYAGFSDNFMTSLHLLMPQIENFVRKQLHEAGVLTSNIKSEIETENGLSSLVENNKLEDIFGKNLWFEFKVLFGGEPNLNLRNKVAHGLLSSDEMKSEYSVYFWWFCFKLVYIGFFHTEKTEVKK